MNFIIEEFKFYKVYLYGRKAGGEQTDFNIDIHIPSGKARLHFGAEIKENTCVEKKGKYYMHVYLSSDKYPAYIDILRNEKPLYFYYDMERNLSYITTEDEPVGEEENL